jgi:hypothetical protein
LDFPLLLTIESSFLNKKGTGQTRERQMGVYRLMSQTYQMIENRDPFSKILPD